MNTYERLEDEACKDGINVIHYDFHSDNIKGLYCDGTIGINKSIKTSTERACVLAEELGHHFTTVGNILNQNDTWHRKQERQARLDGYNRLICLTNLISAYEYGCRNRYEIAEFIGVTEECLQGYLDSCREKYGRSVPVGEYRIIFIPNLMVFKMI